MVVWRIPMLIHNLCNKKYILYTLETHSRIVNNHSCKAAIVIPHAVVITV